MKRIEIKDLLCLCEEDKNKELIINIGMTHVLRENVIIEDLKQEYPYAKILIDTKVTNKDYLNVKTAFDAGADIVSVLACAKDDSIKNTLAIAEYCHGEVLADFIGVNNQLDRAIDLDLYGVDYLLISTPYLKDLEEVEKDFIFCNYEMSVPEYFTNMQQYEECYL